MNKLFKDQDVSLFRVEKETGIGYSLIYPYAVGDKNISNMTLKSAYILSRYFNMTIDEFYKKCYNWQIELKEKGE